MIVLHYSNIVHNYSACRRRGGVINSPRSISLFSFFFAVESWAAAHGEFDVSSYFSTQKICLKHGKLHLITSIL